MTNDVSSERRVESSVVRIADMVREVKKSGGQVGFDVGPVVVHTGGGGYLCDLIRRGYVDVLLAGNAVAVHDVEAALYGTSLGVALETGVAVEGGAPPSHAPNQRHPEGRRSSRCRPVGGATHGDHVRMREA
jgi:hypothetical protein